MSFKAKLSIIFSIIVTIILALNNVLHYFYTRDLLTVEKEKQMALISKEISISIEHSEYGADYAESLIGQQLRIASLVAKYALSPDIDNVSNEQLVQLSKEIGISDITLLKKVGDDIVGLKSSDPKEINMSTKEWGYWFQAFQQLWSNQEVSVAKGQTLEHYWAGPMNVSSTSPGDVNKWGYYKDEAINYIINPYVRSDFITKFQEATGPKAIIKKTLDGNRVFLEITGFNPKAFGKAPILTKSNGVEQVALQHRPILFGEYGYKSEKQDQESVEKAAKTGSPVSFDTAINGQRVLKSFVPVLDSKVPYVMGIVIDYKVIQDVLNEQLVNNFWISLVVLIFVFIISYFLAEYIVRPIHYTLQKVTEIAEGNFGVRVITDRKDEFGLLANRVNRMSQNLEIYTKELQDKKEQMQYQAYHDFLTGLPNRLKFNEDLQAMLAKEGDKEIVVMFLDLDRFKNINDTLGHGVGDRLLQVVTRRMKECLYAGETIYRLGGDEFTILLSTSAQVKSAQEIAQRILDSFIMPFEVDGCKEELFVTGSIGISIYPYSGNDAKHLVKNADRAMYHAKEAGGGKFQIYAPSMNDIIMEEMALESKLHKAISKNELQLYYQPKVDIKTGKMTGMEALLRWFHPTLGWISPAKFIPLAEETGLILPIGEWVLRTACIQNKRWQDAGFPPMRVAVNLSARQFQQENLVDMITQVLQQTQLAPEYLELEITESISMHNENHVILKLRELKELGVHISIDDFGTGYSSLNYLNKFPIDALKIDKSFVNDITEGLDNAPIVKAIIALAHNLKLMVVAEGVETEKQIAFLTEHACDEMQGYFFSKPLSASEFEKRLAADEHFYIDKNAFLSNLSGQT